MFCQIKMLQVCQFSNLIIFKDETDITGFFIPAGIAMVAGS